MFPILALLFLVAPIAELAVILAVGREFGVLPTIAGLLLAGVVGAWLARREGVAAWRRLNEALTRGRMPTEEIADGALILLAGALMAAPGFIGDALGLILLVPPLRAGVRRAALPTVVRYAERQAQRSAQEAVRRAAGYQQASDQQASDQDPGRGAPTGRPWVIDGEAHTSEATRITWGDAEPDAPESQRTRGRGDNRRR